MRRLVRGLTSACFFLLCFAQIPLVAGHFLVGDSLPAMLVLVALLPLSFLISLLPGKVGGGRKDQAQNTVVRSSRGGDPDPDRALRNEALPLPEKKAFPLRAVVCLIACVGVGVAVYLLPMEVVASEWWVRRLLLAAIMAVMLPLALKMVALNQSGANSVAAGIVAYIVAGIIAYTAKDPTLDQRLLLCGLGFVVLTAFNLNNDSMARSAVYREGVRPPASMRRRNRILMAVVLVIGGVVLYFDRIRQGTVAAVRWIGSKIGALIRWLMNLVPLPEDAGGGGGSGGEMDLAGALGGGETGAFWAYTEKIAMAIGVLVGLIGLFFLFKKIGRLLMMLARRLMAHLKKFSEAVGEEYQDEQESLFDWGETRKEWGDGLKKRLERLTRREKKWELMDARERVRFVVRSLYRKTPDSESLRSLTVHEAMKQVKTGQASPEELAALYDQARYGQTEPDMQAAERLRKEAKV